MIHEQKMNNVLQTETEWKVGCGDKIRFWEDQWVGGGEALMMKYPRLYQVSCKQQRVIKQMGRNQKKKNSQSKSGRKQKKRKENSRSKIERKQKKYTERSSDQTISEQNRFVTK